uniref:Site-2 protease family protein n=1 Tax=candidate division WOR-3 bacterium TaxID=2052148 RepID=A0A7C4XBT2_UNCW3
MVNQISEILLSLPPILLALTVHEYFHGLIAYKMGDPTAKFSGRLTLNPLKHLDPLGFFAFLLFRFGWAKPVPVNPYNFKNFRRGIIYTSLAGPLSNFLLAMILGIFIRFLSYSSIPKILIPFWVMLQFGVLYNLILCAFNLIPIPPLDGSKILFNILPHRYENIKFYLERYGFFLLIGLIFIDNLGLPLLWGWIGPFVRVFGNFFAGTGSF